MKFEECKIGDIVTPKSDEIKTHNPNLCSSAIYYITWIKEFIICSRDWSSDVCSSDLL